MSKKGWWERIFSVHTEPRKDDFGRGEYDEVIRALTTPSGDEAGWMLRSQDGRWKRASKDNLKSVLMSNGNTRTCAGMMLTFRQAHVVCCVVVEQEQALGPDIFQLPVVPLAEIAAAGPEDLPFRTRHRERIDRRLYLQSGDQVVSCLRCLLLVVLLLHPFHLCRTAHR